MSEKRPYRKVWWKEALAWLGLIEVCYEHDAPLVRNPRLVCPVCGEDGLTLRQKGSGEPS